MILFKKRDDPVSKKRTPLIVETRFATASRYMPRVDQLWLGGAVSFPSCGEKPVRLDSSRTRRPVSAQAEHRVIMLRPARILAGASLQAWWVNWPFGEKGEDR
jgi:hypothetical protein